MDVPRAERNILSRLDELICLEQMLGDLDGRTIKNKRDKKSIIRKTILSFTVTTWETYVEEIIEEGVDFIVTNLVDHNLLPSKLRATIGVVLKEQKDHRSLWSLAGDGWKNVLKEHVSNQIAAFNTPRSANIDTLFTNTLGLEGLSNTWKWKGITNASVKKKMNHWITLRGSGSPAPH